MANLLEKASILITPTAYDNGSINALKPIETISDELITNGDFDTAIPLGTAGAGWTFIDSTQDGSIAEYYNGGVRVIRTTNQSRFRPVVGNTTSNNFLPEEEYDYVITYEILSSSGSNTLSLSLGGLNHNITSLVGTHTYYLKSGGSAIVQFSPKNNSEFVIDNVSIKQIINADLDFTRATSGSVVGTANRQNANGVLEGIAQNVPRIDYLGGEGHWLIEPQSTNLVTYSDELSQVSEWVKIGFATVNNNQAIAPTDTLIADEVLSGDNSALNGLRIDKSVVSGDDYTFSFFAKKKDTDTNYVAIRFDSFNSAFSLKRAWFNIDSGNLGTVESGITAKIEDYGDGWYRCSATQTATATASSRILMMLTSDDNVSSLGIGLGFYGFGGQFEQQSYATSYIPTNGSTVTRAEDLANNSGNSDLINSAEGVLYAEIAALADDLTNRVISLSDGTSNERVVLQYHNTTNLIRCFIKSGGSFYATLDKVVSDTTDFHKIAYKYKSGETKLFVDGSLIISSSNTFSITGLDVLQFANGTPTASPFYGKTKCIAVFKEALTDSELTCLTS